MALLLAACRAEQRAAHLGMPADGAASCEQDAECESRFCDAKRCAAPAGVYGRACVPAPRSAKGLRNGKLHTCGAYLCIDGRCRSCRSDDECRSELGAPHCVASPDRPGMRCGAG